MDLLNLKIYNINRNKNILIAFSHIIDISIDKLWACLRDLLPSNDKSLKNFSFIKGNNIWKIGNKFTYYWSNIYKVKSETIDNVEENDRKKISWNIETDFGFHYIKSCYLYKISKKEETLLKIIIISEQTIPSNLLLIDKKYFCLFNPYMFLDKNNYIKEEKEKTISYESCIINANYKDIWNLITDFKKLSEIGPVMGTNIEKWGHTFEVGTFWKTYLNNIKKTIFLKVNKVKMHNKQKLWIYSLETIGSDKSIIHQEIELKVVKIEEKKSQLSITNTYMKKINNNYLKVININKRDILKRIKRYLEDKNKINEKELIIINDIFINNIYINNNENIVNNMENEEY